MDRKDTYATFYEHAQLQADGTYKDVIMAEVFIMGNQNTSKSFPVHDKEGNLVEYQGVTLPDKYPRAWANFKRNEGAELDGEPLRSLGGIGPGQVKNLNAMGIETIEDLANLGDSVVIGESFMLDLRNKARAYVASLHPEKAEAERKQAEDRMKSLQDQIAQLQEKLESKPKKGRPKKEVA